MKKIAKIRKKRENKEKIKKLSREKKRELTKFIHLRNEVENTIVRTIK